MRLRLMGDRRLFMGHVESVAGGIDDREREGGGLLANINPTFSWVRLAQRVPVRVRVDPPMEDGALLPGRTVTLWLQGNGGAG